MAKILGVSIQIIRRELRRLDILQKQGERQKLYWRQHPEWRARVSKRFLGTKFTEEHKQKISASHKGKTRSLLHCKHLSEALTDKKEPKSRNQKRSQTMNKHWQDPKYRKRVIKAQYDSWKNPKLRKNRSTLIKRLWRDPEYREKVTKRALKGLFKRPTSFERRVIRVIKKHQLPFDYVGDGKILINYVNPDFINNNGQKLLIEVANRVPLHHPIGYETHRAKRFAKYGFKTLFLRDEDIIRDDWEPHILNKIQEFTNQ